MNLLLPYIQIFNHRDPDFDEYTYGDVRDRAKKLKEGLKAGDYLFFHTTWDGKKYITAYFVVDRVLDVSAAVENGNIMRKYKNPHLLEYVSGEVDKKLKNVIVFGDPIQSKSLSRPLLFNKKLAQKLSLQIGFKRGRTEAQVISSATRAWRSLSRRDVQLLLREIEKEEQKPLDFHRTLSTDEVKELVEKDLENYIEKNKNVIGENLKLIGRQLDTQEHVGRIDLLYQDEDRTKYIVELKVGHVGRDALNQLVRYMSWLRKGTRDKVKGILVCGGVMPVFEDELRKARGITIFRYGWQMKLSRWPG